MTEMASNEVCDLIDDVTVTLRGVTMHPTNPPYTLITFNPWSRAARVDQESPRAWNHGAWSGAEWLDAVTVPLTVLVKNDAGRGTRRWLEVWQPFVAAWEPSHVDVPLEFSVDDGAGGTDDYVMFGRPRLVDPGAVTALRGWTLVACQFRALDPRIYSAGAEGLHVAFTGLPVQTGGFTFSPAPSGGPLTLPFSINAISSAGALQLTNLGTTPTGLQVRIDGSVQEPRFTLQTPDGPRTFFYLDSLADDQWLDVDTRARTVLLNGTVSRRGQSAGDFPLLHPGTWELSFNAAQFDADALITVTWRDAWIA
jgi:hypothetical protein